MFKRRPFLAGDQARVDDTSYDVGRLLRISSAATVVAWLFFAIGAIAVGLGLYSLFSTFRYPVYHIDLIGLMIQATAVSFFVLLCLFFWVTLRALSEAVFILLDTEQNTRLQSKATESEPSPPTIPAQVNHTGT